MTKRIVTIKEVQKAAYNAAEFYDDNNPSGFQKIYGVPRGGIPAAFAVAVHFSGAELVDDPSKATLIVDDIVDSGATETYHKQKYPNAYFLPLFDKRYAPWKGQWLIMPWETTSEHDDSGTDIITRLLQYIGEDPHREGLKDTPKRVLQAWQEWGTGYHQDPATVFKTFEDGACDELVIVHNIPVVSKCEHHLADIIGHAHVGYIPKGKIIGLSKLARLVEIFSRRLQVQERLTAQIADCMMEHLKPLGAGVLIRAAHACMSTRGVKIHGSVTTTSAMRGALLDKGEARKEFMDLCAMAEKDRVP